MRLTFTLYSLKEILAVWKGEDARDARYALGLKDFVATVAALWPEALSDTHRLLATQTLAVLDGRWESVGDEDPLDCWRLQYLVAHVELARKENIWKWLVEEAAIETALDRLGGLAYNQARYAKATVYRSLELAIAQRRVQQQGIPQASNDLANAYMNPGQRAPHRRRPGGGTGRLRRCRRAAGRTAPATGGGVAARMGQRPGQCLYEPGCDARRQPGPERGADGLRAGHRVAGSLARTTGGGVAPGLSQRPCSRLHKPGQRA